VPDLVKMFKPNQRPGFPATADVHPDEVENMLRAGWMEAQAEKDAAPDQGGENERPLSRKRGRPKKKNSA